MNNLAVAREMERAEEDATRFYQDIFNEGNGNLVFPNSTSADEVTNISSPLQENGELFRPEDEYLSILAKPRKKRASKTKLNLIHRKRCW